MKTYIVRRLLILIPTLLLASMVIFFLTRLLPGDIVDVLQAQSTLEMPVDREVAMKALGLDAPPLVQYARWMGFVPDKD